MPKPRLSSRPPATTVKTLAERRAQALANSVAASEARRRADHSVDWDAQIASLRRLLRRMYAKGGMAGPELEHERIDGAS